MSTTKQLKVYKGLPTIIKSRARGYYDDKTVLTFNTDAESKNITMDVYDGLSYDIAGSASGVKVLNFVNTVLPYKWDYSTALSTNRYCFAPVNGGSTVTINTPNITNYETATVNEGVISDITAKMDTPEITIYKDKSFEFYGKIQMSNSFSGIQEIFVVPNCILWRISGTYWNVCYYVNGSWRQTQNSGVRSDGIFFIRLRYFPEATTKDGKSYSAKTVYFEYSSNTTDWTRDYSYSLADYFFGDDSSVTKQTFNMTVGSQNGNELWKGSIDLNECYVKVDDEFVWQGIKTQQLENMYYVNYYKYNNFTKVGSPTVDEDTGLVSGMSYTNYLNTNVSSSVFSSPWRLRYKIHLGSNWSSNFYIGTIGNLGIAINISDSRYVMLYLKSDSGDIVWGDPAGSQLSLSSDHIIELYWDGTAYYADVDGVNVWSVNSTRAISANAGAFCFGSSYSYTGSATSMILDLSETYINVDGSRYWDALGPSSTPELMPGILSNYTDDGSAVTLNCFANGDTSVVLTPDNNYNGTYLGTVNIQAHTAYNYDPDTGEWTPNV
ncbi:MAG: hypothetical protein IJ525_00785 [Alphaproteobacteria bacterium]|nr:hypothetical protein [Alphaproteobacteria bacterium]